MEIQIKSVSNGYVINYDHENRYGEIVIETAVQTDDDELKKFIGGLIFKEMVRQETDNLKIKID